MKKFLPAVITFLLFTVSSFSQIAQLTKLGQLNFTTTCAGVWHYVDQNNREYALLGNGDGLVIVDVTDPANPDELFNIPAAPSLWREVKTYGHYAYSGTEGGGGITIVDLSDLPNSYNSKTYTGDGAIAGQLGSSHTVQIFGDYLYIFGSDIGVGGAIMCSLADPWNPEYVGIYDENYIHDGYVLNDTLYGSEIYAGQFSVVDVTSKSNPVVLATQPTPGAFNHNCWFSDNRQYLYTTDELPNTPVGVFDVSDIGNIQLVETYVNDTMPGEEIHNVRVINDYLINPSYGSQLTIVDGARPDNLIEIARYQTGSYLCWDASPYLPSGNIIATDMDGIFYVFAPYYQRACYLEGNVTDLSTSTPLNNVSVKILNVNAGTQTTLTGDYKTGYPTAGTFDVEFSKAGYITQVINNVQLNNGVLTTLDVQLEAFTATGVVLDNVTGLPVPFARVRAQNGAVDVLLPADAGGQFQLNTLTSGLWDMTAGKWGYRTTCQQVNVGSVGVSIGIDPGIYDDFTFDFGWTVSGNASSGIWERGEPVGTVFTITQANPEVDVIDDCYEMCFVTGNSGGAVNNDDVDDGFTILTSPEFDLTGYTDPYVNYSRWFFEQFSGNPAANDTLSIMITNGVTTVTLQDIFGPSTFNSTWKPESFRVLDFITVTANMKIIVSVSDKPGTGNPLEAAFDKFFVSEGPTGLAENNLQKFMLFPNPAKDMVTLQFADKGLAGDVNVLIHDITGRLVFQTPVSGSEIKINTSHLVKGVYFVSLESASAGRMTQKLIVQ